MTKKERRISILTSLLEELEKEYDKLLDNLIVEETEGGRSKERMLFQKISDIKKELESLTDDIVGYSDKELDEIVTGVHKEEQELSESENKLFDAIAGGF